MKDRPYRVLEMNGACEALVFMLGRPEGFQKVDVRRHLVLSPSTSMRLHTLFVEEGVITVKPDLERHLFTLTAKGRALAKKVVEIEKVLQGKAPP
jgi:hypothetical protein